MRKKIKPQDRMVYPIPERWGNKRNDRKTPDTTHRTQKEAMAAASKMLHKEGGGELVVLGKNGKIRRKDTISPGHDPYPPKG
jgi:hypothetical protein